MVRVKESGEKLYQNQLLTLQILYKFRFGTNELIAKYRGISRSTVNESMLTLVNKGYVERKYDNNKKIKGESAVYYLSSKGIRYLKSKFSLADKIVQALYKNRIVSDQFIEHNLTVFRTYLILQQQYKDSYDVFTKAELAKYDQYPEQLPDLLLVSKDGKTDYMLDIFLNQPFFVIKKRIEYYIDHRDDDWDDSEPYPSILLVCPDARNETKVIKYTESQLEDFDFLITTNKALLGEGKEIWTDPVEPEKLVKL